MREPSAVLPAPEGPGAADGPAPGVPGRTRREAVLLLAAALAGPRLAGAQTATATATAAVTIKDYKFQPERLIVKVGTRVRWTNLEKRTTHSVLFTGPGGFESERLFADESWEQLFDKPGPYPYTCGPHPEMKGHVEVTS